MNFVDESTIERYIRYPDTLDGQKRKEIEAQLKANAEARAVAEFYQTYYEELDGLTEYVPPELESFIDTLFVTSTVVPLFPYGPMSSNAVPLSLNGRAPAFDTMSVLVSHTPQALVCIMRSSARSQLYRLYVLTSNLSDRAHTLVSFPELTLDVVTNAMGVASFRLSDPDIQGNPFETALLRFPVAQIQLLANQLRSGPSTLSATHGLSSLQLSRDEDTLVLSLDADDATAPAGIMYVACEAKDGTAQVFQMDETSQTVRLSDVPLAQACQIYVYL